MGQETVRFGGGKLAFIGVLAGVAIALGLPWIVLVYGQHLGSTVLTIIVICSLIMGGLISLVAAFFGAVIPSVVETRSSKGNAPDAKPVEGETLDSASNKPNEKG